MNRIRLKGYSLKSICDLVGISPQAYHKRLKRQNVESDMYDAIEQIVIQHRQEKSRAGLRSIYHKHQLQTCLGINQYEKQMSLRGHALNPYKSHIKTTDSRGNQYKFDNLISGMELNDKNQVIVGDISYYQNITGLYYIFHFIDYYTLEVKGLLGSCNMEGINAEKCLRQIFNYNGQRVYDYKLILHTDGGSQYRSHKFQQMLRTAKIRPSHAKNCLENGLSERLNGIIKNDYLVDYHIRNEDQLNRVLKKIKYQINQIWPSKTLGYKTPKQYAQYIKSIDTDQRIIKTINIVE